MDKRIKDLVGIYFETLPYSEESAEARVRVENALNREYERFSKKMSSDKAFETIVGSYGKLSDMAVLAGYSAKDADKWMSFGGSKDIISLKKEIKKQRRRIYCISFLTTAAFVELLWFVYDLFFAPKSAVWVLVYIAVLLGGAFCVFRRFINCEKECRSEKYDSEAYCFLRSLSDIYAKRKLNSSAMLFAALAMFLVSGFIFIGNSKSAELAENLFSDIILLEVPVYLFLKNILCARMIYSRSNLPNNDKYKKHFVGVTAFSAVYWLAVTLAVLIFSSAFKYPANVLFFAGLVFFILILIYNVTVRKKVTYKNIVVNKKRIAVITSGAILVSGYSALQRDTWYTQPYINSLPVVQHREHDISYNEQNGVYTIISSSEDFKILHLTDIHLGGSLYSYIKDTKALKAVYAEIEYTQPDLVIVTGDLTFPLGIMSLSLNNSAPVSQFAAFMRNVDIPWAFTYGNHDTESLATLSEGDLDKLYRSLSYKTSGNLLYPYVQPDVTGRNNQLIEIRNSDGTLNQAIFLIDSNAYTGEGINEYDYIHDDQVEWYKNEIRRLSSEESDEVSSMVFFHIPLQQYRTAYELYEQGSDEVTYYFGENGEKMIDKVCCSDHPSKLFDAMLELGSTKAVFCGHDHYNNMSLEYKGIRLTYGMSIDYLAMPGIENDTEQRGAELITLKSDGDWDIEQIPLDSIY